MEGKLFIVSRTDNDSLAYYSPFTIKHAIDFTCHGEVEFAGKTKEGKLLIKTKNQLHAAKLLKMSKLGIHNVKVTECSNHNCSKGVFYCNDLRSVSENVIAAELVTQNVKEVRKLKKRVAGKLTETGLVIVTFDSLKLPEHLMIGQHKVSVRPYIPLPTRCSNCHRFNHTTRQCSGQKICFNCAEHHSEEEDGFTCTNGKNCINCKEKNIELCDHTSQDRICPLFVKYQEIQAIKTLQNVSAKKAKDIYNISHPQPIGPLYSTVLKYNIKTENTN